MVLDKLKQRSSFINKFLFMVWGVLSVLAAQQLWPSMQPEIAKPAGNNPTSAAVATADGVAAQTLGTTEEATDDTALVESAPSSIIATGNYHGTRPAPSTPAYTPPQSNTVNTNSVAAPAHNRQNKSGRAQSSLQLKLNKSDSRQATQCAPTGLCL